MDEISELRSNYLRCAEAIGVVDAPEGHAVQPGPIEDVERAIRESVRRADHLRDRLTESERLRAEAEAECVRKSLLVGLERGKREKAEAKLESFKRMYDAEVASKFNHRAEALRRAAEECVTAAPHPVAEKCRERILALLSDPDAP